MTDPVSIGALILAIISALAVFIKHIRKCRCSNGEIYIERESNTEMGQQQDYTLKLVSILQNVAPNDRPSHEETAAQIIQQLNLEPKTPQPSHRRLLSFRKFSIKPTEKQSPNNKPSEFVQPKPVKREKNHQPDENSASCSSEPCSSEPSVKITSFIAKKPQ